MPVGLDTPRPLAVIGGRAFLSSADYRELAERFRNGDLRDLLSTELFRNVIFSSRHNLNELAAQLAEISVAADARGVTQQGEFPEPQPELQGAAGSRGEEKGVNSVSFPPGINLQAACQSALDKLRDRLKLKSIAIMLKTEQGFAPAGAMGKFKNKLPYISEQGRTSEETELFPLVVGGEMKGALLVGDGKLSEENRRRLGEFCLEMAMPLEVLRLRDELERSLRASYHLQTFTEQINEVEPAEAYAAILRHSTELLHSERGSLLLFDEASNELEVKAAVGPRADVTREQRVRLNDCVSGAVLLDGRPRIVRDLKTTELHRAPAERKYQSDSFISYPIITGGRKVGVINMTDKAGGEPYNDFDLHLLETMAPQMALALDRAGWQHKATQFQLLSITDPLTGLLNRRYLEERLTEEFERSKRHRFPMSFLMIDIDNFKVYNDHYGHQAGDLALEITAQCLKSALRSADVASRYGGEEFSILLPQTSIAEALVIAERIRSRVEHSSYPHGESQPHGAVTVSIGISAFGPKLETPSSVIGAADHALYVAKSRGKNCVVTYAPPPAKPPARDVN